jgi:hypothetical protein
MLTPPSSARRSVGITLIPIVIFLLLVRPYVFRDVVGEEDLVRVANGLLLGHKIGFEKAIDVHYGMNFSYGYYWFIYNVLPSSMFATSADVIRFINESGYLFAGLTLLFGGATVSRMYGPVAGAVTVTVFGFSPMFLELATSGHPLLPAAALFFAAAWLFQVAEDSAAPGVRWTLWLVASALAFASLTTRGETALAFPFLVFAFRDFGLTKVARDKALARGVALTLVFLLFLYLGTYFHRAESTEALDSISVFLSRFYIARNVIKGMVGLVIGLGIVSCAVIGLAFALRTRRHLWPAFLALLLIVPNLVFWLPNGFPVRHFFFALFGGAMFVGVVAQSLMPDGAIRPIAAAALLALLNQVAAEAAFPFIVAKYEWNYDKLGDRRATYQVPLGMFHRNHKANEYMFSTLRAEAKTLATIKDREVVIFADQVDYILLSLIDSADQLEVRPEPSPGITYEVVRGKQKFTLIEKYHQWPADVMGEYVRSRDVSNLRFYVQPSTRSRYDKTELPNELMLPQAN